MARTALSTSRSLDIVELLCSFPESTFTMSEIAKAADINVATCHGILNELTARGYLSRDSSAKTYSLGPALVAMGNAASRRQRLIARANEAADLLIAEHDVPVSLTCAIGDEVIGIFAKSNNVESARGPRPGFRMPLAPPIGAPFLAWSSSEEIDDWISRRAANSSDAAIAHWHKSLEFVREHGYQVLLRSAASDYFPKLISELSGGKKLGNFRGTIAEHFTAAEDAFVQPDSIEPEELYDAIVIAAPIFDQAAGHVYNLCIGDIAQKVTGAQIRAYADSLLRACVDIMRSSGR